jgi:type III pantothenate kinase
MILELDCGNSFIKWRVLGAGSPTWIVAGGVVGDEAQLLDALAQPVIPAITGCRLVSVRNEEETAALLQVLRERLPNAPVVAQSAPQLAGVRNGYVEYQRLGLDRWLALVGAYHICRSSCLVLDMGTAVTADLVDASGQHLGGYICPGVGLMRDQLRTHTRRIRYDDGVARQAQGSLQPGRTTVEAVERGCLLMLQGFVNAQVTQARERLGGEVAIFLAGGDCALAADWVVGARLVPDLVFRGLAIACPLGEG